MKAIKILTLTLSILLVAGCSALTPELLKELAKDNASACFSTDVRGGAGAMVGSMTGGYGQATLRFCRSNKDNAKITMGADGSIAIQNGD